MWWGWGRTGTGPGKKDNIYYERKKKKDERGRGGIDV